MLIFFCSMIFCSLSLLFLNKYAPKLDNNRVFFWFSKNISFRRNAVLVFPFTPVISIVLMFCFLVSSFQSDKTSSVAWWWLMISYWFICFLFNSSSMFNEEWIGLIIRSFSFAPAFIFFVEFSSNASLNESKSLRTLTLYVSKRISSSFFNVLYKSYANTLSYFFDLASSLEIFTPPCVKSTKKTFIVPLL